MGYRKEPNTVGGKMLRALREAHSKTQLDIELNANLGIGYLQRLELGKVKQPERETLLRIVDVIGAAFVEKRRVLHSFGYVMPITIPDESEILWASQSFFAQSYQAIPAYLLDYAHRLLAWNVLVLKFFGHLSANSKYESMPQMMIDPASAIYPSILNRDEFFPTQMQILCYERTRCGETKTFVNLLNAMRCYETFEKYWTTSLTNYAHIRPIAHLKLDTAYGVLEFRLMSQPFVDDPRFRVIYFMPANAGTMHLCDEWNHA